MIIISCPSIFADQIILKNGDRLTGKIVKKDGDKIIIETESAGIITILWSAVEKIVSEEPLNLKLSDGQFIKGTVATENEKIEVETQDAGKVEVAKENIEIVRSVAEQEKFEAEEERLRNPSLLDLWRGSVDVGFSFTSGNSNTRALTAGLRGNRQTYKDKISVYANAIQASNSNSSVSVTTAQALYGGIRYDYDLSEKTFVFASGDFEYDKPQQLDLRSVIGAGLGYKAIRSDRLTLDLFGGATYNRENFSTGEKRNSAEALIGNELTYKLTDNVYLEQRLSVYPSITEGGKYRALFDSSLVTNINDWLGWQVTIGDRFNSNPALGSKQNDFLFSTGLRATFGRNK
jgi:putative salt-induced outer membrane protein YdiY